MMNNRNPGRGLVRRLGLAAAAMLVLSAASQQRAEALSLVTPGTAPLARQAADRALTEVRHGGHGGGGFHHGGGFHGGGAVFHGGGYRAAPVYHGGGYRYAYHRHHFQRHHFQRHHFHRRFYYTPSYYYYPRRCRIVWTYYGPRKICHYRHWHRHHYWRHRSHHYGYPYRY
ncbi:MAG: hypothetical protein WCE35_09785 [Bradyrhizobium sp.]